MPSRRLLLGGLAAASVSNLLPARAAPPARAITVGCWGGVYAEALRSAVDAGLRRDASVSVRQSVAGEPARVARIGADGGTGEALDVAMLSDLDAYRLSLRQLFRPVTTSGVASLPHVLAGLRAPYAAPQSHTALCIAYNRGKRSTPPRGFGALFEAARRGQAGFSSELAIHNLAAAAVSRTGPASLDAAKVVFASLRKAGSLRIYADNEALGRALAAGEISMAPIWRSRAYVWQQAGHPISDIVPVEGAIPFTIMAAVPATSRQPDTAMLYLDALLHPDVQLAFAERVGLLPTVDTAVLPEKLRDRIGFTAAQRARFRPVSLSAAARNGIALRQFWDSELA